MPQVRITRHCQEQAAAKGIELRTVCAVLDQPAVTYDSAKHSCRHHNLPQQRWTGMANGQRVCVAVNPCCNVAVTVWLDQVETEILPDQRAQGVRRYKGKDGKWRS